MKLIKNIQSIAKEVIRQEAEALHKIVELIDDEFENCVYTILNSGGRVVISGVGKSAIVGQKIVATLNSTGTPAFFMHAADAIHGDLGMIQANDVVLVISKSGDTDRRDPDDIIFGSNSSISATILRHYLESCGRRF